MAPVNGVGGNSANAKTAAVRPPNRVVVPVLPLNFPQRPANKPPAPPPAIPYSLIKPQNGTRPNEQKAAPDVQKQSRDHLNGTSTSHGPSPTKEADASTPPAAPARIVTTAEQMAPAPAQEELDKDTPTISSTFPDRRMLPTTRTRPPGLPNPASEPMSASGPIPEGPIMAPPPPAFVNRPAFHQPHPSNGSLGFNGFHDSNTSSPAPRTSAAFGPPPGLLPYPPPAVDAYGRPVLVSPVVDGFPPNHMNHHGPPTPHSFHGSHSSGQAEDHGYNTYGAPNGNPAHPVPSAGQTTMPPPGLNPPMNGTVPAASPSAAAYQSLCDQDEALSFLRHGISDATFNDCVLEVRFSDSQEFQDHPNYRQLHRALRTPGHRFIFSRSPVLAGVMKTQGSMPGSIIYLDANDEYLRSDTFWFSLRTLYGWSLADGILPTELALRDVGDDLKTALSYIATARYLQLPWVRSVAIHRASRLIFWNTIESAAKFVSRIVAVSPRDDAFGISEFLEQVLGFIVHNFPTDFVLDAQAGDYGFSRFPPSAAVTLSPNAPAIANGTSGGLHSRQSSLSQTQMPRNSRAPSAGIRLSQLKFGDMSPAKNGQQPRPPTTNDTILSRILLNLPFELLKQILEHPSLAKLSGELGPKARQSIIAQIIAEREARRQAVLDKTSDPKLRVYQERVEKSTVPLIVGHMEDFWVNNLGFREEVFPGDLPYLVHTWSQPASATSSA
ncbi:uncharacterized protein C8A04DRAFT_10492 [Dichotomopilus funicola]|uniref:Uncharacterized protein n=1 Tax=Dichotomopilus funicola TaxID=1934379 RepID=A0AAN6V7W0_9PEZI|nr:hypothetical protein C8A04DRAFT_10492 [Dichotomopilus funicola]